MVKATASRSQEDKGQDTTAVGRHALVGSNPTPGASGYGRNKKPSDDLSVRTDLFFLELVPEVLFVFGDSGSFLESSIHAGAVRPFGLIFRRAL